MRQHTLEDSQEQDVELNTWENCITDG